MSTHPAIGDNLKGPNGVIVEVVFVTSSQRVVTVEGVHVPDGIGDREFWAGSFSLHRGPQLADWPVMHYAEPRPGDDW